MVEIYNKKKFPNLYDLKDTNPFFLSIGVLIGGLLFLNISNFFFGKIELFYTVYGLLTWFWLRFLEITTNFFVRKKINFFSSFSYSWSLPIIVICFLGFLNIKLPIIFISIIAALDIIFFIFNALKNKILFSIKYFISGLILGSVLIGLSTTHSTTVMWMEQFLHLGTEFPADFMRDVAYVNSWSEYGVISQGYHGLLPEVYHNLYIFFTMPFINDQVNTIKIFVIFATLIIPPLLVYGSSKLIINMGHRYISNNWHIFLLIFILTFSAIDYVIAQRSVMIATLLLIAFIPLTYQMVTKTSNHFDIIVFSILIPLTILARAYHGLFLLGISIFFLIYKKFSQKIIIFLSIVISVSILFFHYRSPEIYPETEFIIGYFKYFLRHTHPYINNFLIPILIFLFSYFMLKNKNFLNKKFYSRLLKNKFNFFIIFNCLIIIFLSLRGHQREIFYQLFPFYWFIFFFVITPNFLNFFFKEKKLLNFFKGNNVSFILILIVFLASLTALKNYGYGLYSEYGTIKKSIKSIRVLNDSWKDKGGNELFLKNIDIEECKNLRFDLFCEIRTRIFSVSNFERYSFNFAPRKILEKVKKVKQNLKGNTAIYISPSNEYWDSFELSSTYKRERYYKLSRYFMIEEKIPMIFGVHPKDKRFYYSKSTAIKYSGDLKELNMIGNSEKICSIGNKLKIDNIIIFEKNIDIYKIISCS